MSLTMVQTLLTNPMAAALDQVLAFHGPQQLETWIQGQTAMVDEIPAGGLEESIQGHPVLKRVAGGAIRKALAGWNPEWAATVLEVMYGIAPAIAREQAAPAYQPQLTAALQQMCRRLGQPDAFPWFCAQCEALAIRVRTVLGDNPPTAS